MDQNYINIPPPPLEEPNTGYKKDESAYAGLIHSEDDQEAVNLYNQSEQDIKETNYSSLINKARETWIEEQDLKVQRDITNLIEDPLIDINIKKQQLQKYIDSPQTYSLDIKDQWVEELNDSYIIENKLEESDEYQVADEQVLDLRVDQTLESMKESTEKVTIVPPSQDEFNTRFNRLLDTWSDVKRFSLQKSYDTLPENRLEGEITKPRRLTPEFKTFIEEGQFDPSYLPVLDDVAFLFSMFYHLPDYGLELLQTWQGLSGPTGIDMTNPLTRDASMSRQIDRTKVWTDVRKEIQELRKTAMTKKLAEGMDFVMKSIGYDTTKFSVAKMPFDVLGEGIDYIAQKDKDPGRTSLALETALLFLLPYGVKKGKQFLDRPKKIKRDPLLDAKEVFSVKDPELQVVIDKLPKTTITPDGVVVPIEYKPTKRITEGSVNKRNKAYYNKKTNNIVVDAEYIIKSFPKTPGRFFVKDGVVVGRSTQNIDQSKDIDTLLREDVLEIDINTGEEMVIFVIEHEKAHVTNPQLPKESKADYETRINKIANDSYNDIRYKMIQPDMPASGNPKIDTPLATTNVSNPKAGTEMFADILENPKNDNIVGLTREQKLLKMFDPVDNVYKSNNIGPIPDASSIAGIIRARDAENRMSLIDPSDPHYTLKEQYIFDTLELNDAILKNTQVVQAPSLDLVNGTGTGFVFGVAYRKSFTENFKDPVEVMTVYKQIRDRILETRKAKELPVNQTLSIHEVFDRDGAFQPLEIYENGIIPPERINQNKPTSFIIRWNEETSFTEFYKQELTRTPEETYPNKSPVSGLFPWLTTKVLSGSNSLGPTAYWNMSIGRFPKAITKEYRQSMLRVEQFTNPQRQEMLENVVVKLGSTEQIMLDKVLRAAQTLKIDYPQLNLIKDVLPPKTSLNTLLRIQNAASHIRVFLNSIHRYKNSEAYSLLYRAGYKDQLIITDPVSGNPQVFPAQKNFYLQESDRAIVPQEEGGFFYSEAYHTDYQRMVLITVSPEHMKKTGEVYNFVDGVPREQVYRSAHIFEDPSNPLGIKTDYIISPTTKLMPLQSNLIRYIDGHIPRINTDSVIIEAIPKDVVRNGQRNVFKEDFGTNKQDGLYDFTTLPVQQKQRDNVQEFLQAHEQYARVVATFETKQQAREWAKTNLITKAMPMYPNHVFSTRLGKDLQEETLRMHYEAEANQAMSKNLRGNLLHWETADGPLKASLVNSHTTGKKYLNNLAVSRMEDMFIELYVNPGTKSVVGIKPNPKDSISKFPVSVDYIYEKPGGSKAALDQAQALFNQIQRLRVGTPNRDLATFTFNTAKTIADKMENDSKFLKIFNSQPVVKTLRKTQRGSKEIEGFFQRALTFWNIRLNPLNMLLVQSPAALMNLIVYGQDGPLYNPIKMMENFRDTTRLFSAMMHYNFKSSKLDQAFYESFDKYFAENAKIDLLPKEKGRLGYQDKFTTEDFIMIIKEAKETGFYDVINHEFMTSLFSNQMIELGAQHTSFNKTPDGIKDLTLRMFNPFKPIQSIKNLTQRFTDASGRVFIVSEVMSRPGQTIAAIRNWQTKNPGKNWRNKKAMTEIMFGADLLAGSMHQYARYKSQEFTSSGLFAKFTQYVDKQREMLTNQEARIGTAKEAWAVMAGWGPLSGVSLLGLYGGLLWGLESIYDSFLEDDDPNKAMKDWDRFSIIDYAVEYMMTGEMNEGDRLLIGEKITPYPEGTFGMGFKGQLYNLAVFLAFRDTTTDKNIFFALLEKTFGSRGTMPMILGLYDNPMLQAEEKAEVAAKLLASYIPFFRNMTKLDQQLLSEDLTTRSGHPMGVGGSKADIIIRSLFGIQTRDEKDLWKIITEDSKRRKLYQDLARKSVDQFFLAKGSSPTLKDIKDHTALWVHVLQENGYVNDTSEAFEFIAEFESLVRRQDESLVNILANQEIADIVMQEMYSEETVDKLLKLARISRNTGDYIQAEKAQNRAEFMIKINKEYKEQKSRREK